MGTTPSIDCDKIKYNNFKKDYRSLSGFLYFVFLDAPETWRLVVNGDVLLGVLPTPPHNDQLPLVPLIASPRAFHRSPVTKLPHSHSLINMARPSVAARNLSLTEELEKLEQSITLTLQGAHAR